MSFDPQDPKWTAYVVGELDEHQRSAMEDELQSSPEARQLVDELRTLANSVKLAVASEPALGLSSEQRRVLLSAASAATIANAEPAKQLAARQPQPWGKLVFAFAAGLLVAAFCLPALQSAQWNLQIASAPASVVHSSGSMNHSTAPTASHAVEKEMERIVRLNSLVREETNGISPAGDPNARAAHQKGLADPLSHVEHTSKPFPDDHPIVYPEAQFWQQLTERRKQYTESDLKRASGDPLPTSAARPSPAGATANGKPKTGVVLAEKQQQPLLAAGATANGKPRITAQPVFSQIGEGTTSPLNGGAGEQVKKDLSYPVAKQTHETKSNVAASGEKQPDASPSSTPGQSSYGYNPADHKERPANLAKDPGFSGATRVDAGTLTLGGAVGGGVAGPAPVVGNAGPSAVPHFADQPFVDNTFKLATPQSDPSGAAFGNTSIVANVGNEVILNEGLSPLLPRSIVDSETDLNAEAYEPITDNPFLRVVDNALSTFSVDVDTASYSNLRRFLLQNRQLPPRSAVRIEELLNYFPYQYAPPQNEDPFAVHTEVAACPWNGDHRLLRIGIKGREIAADRRPATNLVFLLDVSGSMNDPHKLPLVKEALRLLIQQLGENDRVAIVVYAGSSGLVLPSTTGDQKSKILAALDNLQAGGSTNGGQGIQLAYDIAAGNFIKGGANRVILATDGDFNVGVTDRGELIRLIEEKAKTGVFLTALGFGMGNLKDNTLEQLADKGNGAYAYIDDLREARKVFVEQMSGTLVTIAKDVKLQLEFNPGQVAEYRLIGYENRALKNEDFNNDQKDAGDIGAGHTVTALYELVPAGKAAADESKAAQPKVDALKYSQPATLTAAAQSGELLTLKLRFKQPDGAESRLIEHAVKDDGQPYAKASVDFKFASAVALFGMLLRDSPYHGKTSFDTVLELAQEGQGADQGGYRAELLELVRAAKQLKGG